MIDDRPNKLPCPYCKAKDSVEWCWTQYGQPVSDAAYRRGHWESRCNECGETVTVEQYSFSHFETRV